VFLPRRIECCGSASVLRSALELSGGVRLAAGQASFCSCWGKELDGTELKDGGGMGPNRNDPRAAEVFVPSNFGPGWCTGLDRPRTSPQQRWVTLAIPVGPKSAS
jgi:hypothetical protein